MPETDQFSNSNSARRVGRLIASLFSASWWFESSRLGDAYNDRVARDVVQSGAKGWVLEISCGNGHVEDWIRRLKPLDHLIGSDVDPDALKAAKASLYMQWDLPLGRRMHGQPLDATKTQGLMATAFHRRGRL